MDKQKTTFLLKIFVVFSICVIASVRYFSLERKANPLDGAEQHYGDQITYNYLATQLLHDRVYAENWPPENNFRAWRPPGYPVFLALLLWLGQNNLQFVISVQYLLLVLTGLFVFYLGSKTNHSFFSGLIACVAFYSFAPIGHLASLIMSETLFMFLVCFFLIFLYEGFQTRWAVFYICAGCFLGLSALVRTVTLPFLGAGIGIMLVGWILFRNPRHAQMRRDLSLLIISAWFMVIPVTIRNYVVLHDFVLVATADGMNFYFGTKSPLNWTKEHEMTVNPLRTKFGEVGSRNKLFKLAVKTIYLNPGKYLIHKIRTIGDHIIPNLRLPDLQMPNLPYRNLPSYFRYTEKIERATHFLFWIGCLMLVIRRDLWSCVFLLFYFSLVASSSLTFNDCRFVIVTLPIYFIICAGGVTGILNGAWHAAGRLFRNDSKFPKQNK